MKQTKKAITCLIGVALLTLVAGVTASAASYAPQIVVRPLTPGDITIYKLPSTTTETSPGLSTIAVGAPVYLEVEWDKAIAASNIVSVTWSITNTPASSASTLTNSPLGANVPIYDVADRLVYQVAGRSFLRMDLEGQYTVKATVVVNSNSVPVTTTLSKTLTCGTYMGLNTCALCHSGGTIAENKLTPWQNTKHAHIFTDGINGGAGTSGTRCFGCHTVGYNANTNTIAIHMNGGFDDVAQAAGWTWPTVLAPTNWAYMQATYPSVANLANIQCENCHGPGSQHAHALGDPNLISKSVASGDCNQCHDAPTHHIFGTQWLTSAHAGGQSTSARTPSGPTRWMCVGCHTADGFIGRADHMGSTAAYTTNTVYSSIDCQTCHEPHGETTPAGNVNQLRMLSAVTMPDGTVVSNAGKGAICLQCHQVRNGSAATQLANYPVGKLTWFGGSSFGVHDAPQGDLIEGVNAFTYGQSIPSAAHRNITNLCVACHMQEAGSGTPAYLQAGGHTFGLTYNVVSTNGSTLVTNVHEMTEVCAECHGEVESFNLVRQDYNGDGLIEGVQTEVQKLLNKLSAMLPNSTYQANSNNYVAAGVVQTSVSFKTNWPSKYLMAGYNWQFVANDGSKGVHNAPFAVGLLKASIADLTGDANSDGLADWWQIKYFGSITNQQAAPYAAPAGDGVPNWLKYNCGLDPLTAGVPMTGGFVFGPSVVNPQGTNDVAIYTAAEVTFNTQVGTAYQIQSVSAMGDEWQNVGGSIAGTGGSISYVTQTREPKQQFFRVVHTP